MSTAMLFALAAIFLSMMITAVILLHMITQQDLRRMRLFEMQRSAGLDVDAELANRSDVSLVSWVAALGRILARSGVLPASTLAELELNLSTAGFRYSNALGLFIGAKVIMAVILPVIAFLVLQHVHISALMRTLLMGASFVLGLLGPDMILRRRRQRHLKGVAKGLPDALDMLVICSEAGLGLEAGLDRVTVEIAPAFPEVAYEFGLTSTELRITSDRRAALLNLGTRTGLSVMQRLGTTLVQTLQYGTPLSQALRTLASEMRYEMQIQFETRAARLPVLLTLPMILFILPCIFIVVGGPAGLTIVRNIMHHP
jgi:tight adherence protein C